MSDVASSSTAVPECVAFAWDSGRLVRANLVVGLVAAVVGSGVVAVVFGVVTGLMPGRHYLWVPVNILVYPVGYVCGSLLATQARPPWLRIGSAGVELAASRTDPVFIPWSAVSSARVRWPWPLTFLEITTREPAAVVRHGRGGRRPGRRRRDGSVRFRVDVVSLRPGPDSIVAEFLRHGVPFPDRGAGRDGSGE